MSTTLSASNLGPAVDISVDGVRDFCLLRLKRIVVAMPLRLAIISLILLVPCWWQPQIAAGDLASHAYNAWLVQLVKHGKAPGLSIATGSTNVLFDFMLDGLIDKMGIGAAQRLAVGFCVLIFFWGAFALVTTIARKLPWFLTPLLAILTYGTVFNMGLFNYYLGGALALAALAVLWRARLWDGLFGFGLLALAWFAQPLPALWAAAIFGYVVLARRLSWRGRLVLISGCLGALVLLRVLIQHFWQSTWEWRQALHATGADQAYMFGHHYRVITLAILVIWTMVFIQLARETGWKQVLNSIPVQVYLLCVFGCFLLPYNILFPWYKAAFGGVTERIAWLAAVVMCGLMSSLRNMRFYGPASALIAIVYFGFLYSDARAVNRIEQQVVQLVSTLPHDQRILAELRYPTLDGFDESMLADRACIGKCFSFGNYEAATAQFRIRAQPGNSIVAWTTDNFHLGRRVGQAEQFFASQPDGSLYWIHACGNGLTDVCMQRLSRDSLASLK